MTISIDYDDLTEKEKEAVKQIDRAMKILSKRHWFFAASSDLCVMRFDENGDRGLCDFGSMDQSMIAASITGYNIDGGDW